jgi:hypothetical protein
VCSQSSSLICVDIAPTPPSGRSSINQNRFSLGIGNFLQNAFRSHGLNHNSSVYATENFYRDCHQIRLRFSALRPAAAWLSMTLI